MIHHSASCCPLLHPTNLPPTSYHIPFKKKNHKQKDNDATFPTTIISAFLLLFFKSLGETVLVWGMGDGGGLACVQYFFSKRPQYYWVGPFVHMVRLIMLSATLRGCLTKIHWYNGLARRLAITITGRQFQILSSPHNGKPSAALFIKEEVIFAWDDG